MNVMMRRRGGWGGEGGGRLPASSRVRSLSHEELAGVLASAWSAALSSQYLKRNATLQRWRSQGQHPKFEQQEHMMTFVLRCQIHANLWLCRLPNSCPHMLIHACTQFLFTPIPNSHSRPYPIPIHAYPIPSHADNQSPSMPMHPHSCLCMGMHAFALSHIPAYVPFPMHAHVHNAYAKQKHKLHTGCSL